MTDRQTDTGTLGVLKSLDRKISGLKIRKQYILDYGAWRAAEGLNLKSSVHLQGDTELKQWQAQNDETILQ